MKKGILIIYMISLVSCKEKKPETMVIDKPPITISTDKLEWLRLKKSLDSLQPALQAFVSKKNYNRQLVFVAHLGIHSGLPRMVVWNLEKQKIVDSGLVAHGSGTEGFAKQAIYSNMPNSYCSSTGRYKIGNRYKGNFGWSYKLQGLDSSNSNALGRFIVLHPYTCVPDEPIFPQYICNSLGCPMLAQTFMDRISTIIGQSSRPMLLWIIQ